MDGRGIGKVSKFNSPSTIPQTRSIVLITEQKRCIGCGCQYEFPSHVAIKIEHERITDRKVMRTTYAPVPTPQRPDQPSAVETSSLPRERHLIHTTTLACQECFRSEHEPDQLGFEFVTARRLDRHGRRVPVPNLTGDGNLGGNGAEEQRAATNKITKAEKLKKRGDELLSEFMKGDF